MKNLALPVPTIFNDVSPHRPDPRLLLLAAAVAFVAAPRQPQKSLPRVPGRLRRPRAPPTRGAAPDVPRI